jgi:spore coat protein CotF
VDDKELMENHLLVVKGICDLYMHGSIESPTAEVHTAFKDALSESLDIQNKIYNLMAARNWYSTNQAESTKIAAAKQKFSNSN